MNMLLKYCWILICSFTLLGCQFGEIKSVATTGQMLIEVDENIEPLMREEVKEFERLNPEAKIQIKVVPTKVAKADLINGDTKFIVVTRNFDSEELAIIEKNKLEVKEYPIAIDGIAFIVNLKNPIKRVTSEDLKNIFTGQYKNWTDIKSQDEEQNKEAKNFFTGANNKIKLFIQRKNSSTYDYVLDSILQKMEYSTTAIVCSTSVQMLNSVRENENAIGIINMSWLSAGKQDVLDSTVRALRISKIWNNSRQDDFAEFHQGLLHNGKYPYRRTVYVLTTDVGIKLSTGFITFLVKTDGQKIVLKNGLVPVTQPIRTIEIN